MKDVKYTFIDLFAGIGGIRQAFESTGCKCIFSSEWNKFACDTYELNFHSRPHGDITKIPSSEIPDHDILVGGFPCQPFSISGKKYGFEDPAQGTLFFEIKRILKDKQPRAFLLENVKYLEHHDGGRTFKVIMRILENELGYSVFHQVIDAQKLVPQHRERIYLVGFKQWVPFKFTDITDHKPRFSEILEPKVDNKYTLTDNTWKFLQAYAAKHKAAGNGFGFGMTNPDGVSRTLSARYYKDGSEILIPQEGKNPRRMTPRECARLMGFSENFKIEVSDTQAYRQFGNSVVVPVVSTIAKAMVKTMMEDDKDLP